jgi:hypothetical protein
MEAVALLVEALPRFVAHRVGALPRGMVGHFRCRLRRREVLALRGILTSRVFIIAPVMLQY